MMLKIGISFAVRRASCVLRKVQDAKRKAQGGFTPLEAESPKETLRSPIGDLPLTGFTLIEVMVATCILSLGAVLICGSMFISMDSFNYCANYLDVVSWMDEKIWVAQDDLSRLGALSETGTTGKFLNQNKKIKWNLSYNLISQDFYQIDLILFWNEGQRNVKLLRSTYALYEPRQ